MNHWFDDLTKQLAADTLSRRSVLAAATATLAAVATGTGWPRLLSAAALKTAAAQPNGYQGPRPAPVKLKYGPCTLTSTGAALKHEMTSQTTSGGKTVVLHATRASDLKGMTHNKTVLINGKRTIPDHPRIDGILEGGPGDDRRCIRFQRSPIDDR